MYSLYLRRHFSEHYLSMCSAEKSLVHVALNTDKWLNCPIDERFQLYPWLRIRLHPLWFLLVVNSPNLKKISRWNGNKFSRHFRMSLLFNNVIINQFLKKITISKSTCFCCVLGHLFCLCRSDSLSLCACVKSMIVTCCSAVLGDFFYESNCRWKGALGNQNRCFVTHAPL